MYLDTFIKFRSSSFLERVRITIVYDFCVL